MLAELVGKSTHLWMLAELIVKSTHLRMLAKLIVKSTHLRMLAELIVKSTHLRMFYTRTVWTQQYRCLATLEPDECLARIPFCWRIVEQILFCDETQFTWDCHTNCHNAHLRPTNSPLRPITSNFRHQFSVNFSAIWTKTIQKSHSFLSHAYEQNSDGISCQKSEHSSEYR